MEDLSYPPVCAIEAGTVRETSRRYVAGCLLIAAGKLLGSEGGFMVEHGDHLVQANC